MLPTGLRQDSLPAEPRSGLGIGLSRPDQLEAFEDREHLVGERHAQLRAAAAKNRRWASSHHAKLRSPSPSSQAKAVSTSRNGLTSTCVVRITATGWPRPSTTTA